MLVLVLTHGHVCTGAMVLVLTYGHGCPRVMRLAPTNVAVAAYLEHIWMSGAPDTLLSYAYALPYPHARSLGPTTVHAIRHCTRACAVWNTGSKMVCVCVQGAECGA